MSNFNKELRASVGLVGDEGGSCEHERTYIKGEKYLDDTKGDNFSDSRINKKVIGGTEDSHKSHEVQKNTKLKGKTYDVEKASKYFKDNDFHSVEKNVIVERNQYVEEIPDDDNNDDDNDGGDWDSDVSSSNEDNDDRSHLRKGSYDFFSGQDYDKSNGLEDDDDNSSSEEDSEFDSDQDSSNVTVSEYENSNDEDEEMEHEDSSIYITKNTEQQVYNSASTLESQVSKQNSVREHEIKERKRQAGTTQTGEIKEQYSTVNNKHRTDSYEMTCSRNANINELSDPVNLPRDYVKCETHMDILDQGHEQESQGSETESLDVNSAHGLIRKPAVRRRGYAWTSKTLPQSGNDRMRLKYQKADQGSPNDPANFPGNTDKDNLFPPSTKARSLPVRPGEDDIDGNIYYNTRVYPGPDRLVSTQNREAKVPMVPCDVDFKKKRPLSRSSVSSNSLTSSSRQRKKKANEGNDAESFVENEQWYNNKLDSDLKLVSESKAREKPNDFTKDDKVRERNSNNMSLTSSETGSLKGEVESYLARDLSTKELSSTEERGLSQTSSLPDGSNFQSSNRITDTEGYDNNNGDISTKSTSLSPDSSSHPFVSETSDTAPDLSSPTGPLSPDVDAASSPEMHRRPPSSFSRHEARMKFFNNYEEYMNQSPTSPGSLVEENTSSSEPQSLSSSKSSSVRSSSSLTASIADIQDNHDGNPASAAHEKIPFLAPTTVGFENRRGSSSKITRNSERSSRRSDRRGSKHDAFSRTGFSRSSKRRDQKTSSDPGHMSYVSRVVTEIIESERTYIASLEDIIHGYMEPMEKILCSIDAKQDMECLFSNIRDIYKFGCIFLADLETAGTDPVKVAECFVRHNKGFVIYTDYCTNYPRAVEVLTKFMQHPELSEFCKERQLALGHGLPLGAYLLKPVQRILKYHLLLQNIVKSCEKEKTEAGILEQAFRHMTEMAHHINEMKRKHEHAVRIQEIQSQLEDYVGEDLTRLGELVLEGTFKVYGAKASRQVFLFERGLLISKKKEGGMLGCKAFIKCSNLMLVEVIPNEPLSFHIIPFDNPRTQYTLQARNMEVKRKWCQDIKQLILESFKGRIPDNVKSLIMQLGKEHDDDYVSKESLEAGRKNQHTAPEYLEKRRYRGKSGSRMPEFNLLKPQKARRAGNKKGDEKMFADEARRAASKSPEVNRRIFSKQNFAAKGRSLSSSSLTSPITESLESNNAIAQLVTKNAMFSYPITAFASPESPEYRKLKDSNKEEETLLEKVEGRKRPASFLMARANPILSDDLTNLLAEDRESADMESSPPLEDNGKTAKIISSNIKKSGEFQEATADFTEMDITGPFEHVKESKPTCPLDVNMPVNGKDEPGAVEEFAIPGSVSDNAENAAILKASDHLSRKSMENCDQNFREAESIEHERNCSKKEPKDIAFDSAYNKTSEEVALKKKGLRLPNTSKCLLTSENKDKAKLTNWNSVDKLTKGSMDDLSHLDEDPWVRNSEVTSSMINLEPESSISSRPRGHSDITEMMHVSNNKENMDWIVYLNRNSSTTMGYQPSGHETRGSTSALDKYSTGQTNEDMKNQFPSETFYATPPREYMAPGNIEKLSSGKGNGKNGSSHQDQHGRTSNNASTKKINAFGLSPKKVTVAKPVSFTSRGLLQGNSTPISDNNQESVASKGNPFSLDIDEFPEEDNRSGEEEYINQSLDNINSNIHMPTTPPTITVEEEADNNRLSVVSSISSSSYESPSSSSSDGLVGTLKSKLHAWTKQSRVRHDSDISCTSTLTSDEEDRENLPPKSGNTFESSTKSKLSWKEDRQLETVLRECSLGSSKIGSRMAHSTTQPTDIIHHHCSNSSANESFLPNVSGVSSTHKTTKETDKFFSEQVNSPKEVEISPLPKTEALTPQYNDNQHSDSGFFHQSDESNISDSTPSKQEIAQKLFEDSSNEETPKSKSNVYQIKTNNESPNFERSDSSGSLESKDSFYERKLSAAFDSDFCQEKSETEKTSGQDIKEEEAFTTRRTIREYVKDLEERLKAQSPKLFEVKRKEPGVMIRQRLKTLRESALHGWRNTSIGYDRLSYEEKPPLHSYYNAKTFTVPKNSPSDNSVKYVCLRPSKSRDSLAKSVENLSKSRDNVFLSRSRDSLNSLSISRDSLNLMSGSRDNLSSISDASGCIHSAPVFSLKTNNSGHEKDTNRFHYKAPEHSQATFGNQFIHRSTSSSHRSMSQSSAEGSGYSQSSKFVNQKKERNDGDNLVVMKGWVRCLISKFQVQ